MKILHTESSRGWGGQEIRILNESAGMVSRGHEVTIGCTPGSNIALEANARHLKVAEFPIEKPTVSGVRAFRQWLKRNPVDIVNTHSSTDSWVVALATRFWKDAPKVVRTRHISAPVATHFLARWLYKSATDHIVTTGERLRQTLIHDNQYDPDRITSVPTGIDIVKYAPGDKLAARKQLDLPEKATIIGIVATLRSWKGHQYLIDAFADLQRDNTHLLIVGNGPQQANLKQRIFELGIRRKVSMPGNQDDVTPWLQSMDIFALPSYANEGVPQSLMQAMACELPVVSTPVGSIDELVKAGETGLMVDPKDRETLATALTRLIDDEQLRRTLGKAGRKRVEQAYTDTRMLDRMEKIFSDVLDV